MAMAENGLHEDGRGEAECAAHDLKDLMGRVLEQISDSERRNGELLRQMQGRLELLGEQARSSRSSVPSEYLPGFDRIEDGMSLLAHRIAATYAAARSPVASSPAHPFAAAVPRTVFEPAAPAPFAVAEAPAAMSPVFVPPPTAPQSNGAHPQPLRSGTTGLVASRSSKYGPNVDTFDVVESLPGNPSEPWAPDQVAALSAVYASRNVIFTGQPDVHDPAPEAGEAPASGDATTTQALAAGHDRDWLEGRLGEIAARIDQSLHAVRPEHTIASIERRFDDLERQMTGALRGLATVSDVSGLHLIEAHIQELNAKFESLHGELMRIHGLERQLDSIVHQVSDEKLSFVLERALKAHMPAVTSPRADIEFHSVAIAAAEAAASRVALAQRDPHRDGNRTDDVHSLLSSFIEERRQGDDNTAAMLDTLQQAMLRMLDRMEVIEDGHPDSDERHAYQAAGIGYVPEPLHAPDGDEARTERWAEAAPVAQTSGVKNDDPIARQRAELQASAQRAAQAQREKLRAEAAAPANGARGAAAKKAAAAKTVKPERPVRRLMVSGIALAALTSVGFGAVMLSMPDNASPVMATAAPTGMMEKKSPAVAATVKSGSATLTERAAVQPPREAQGQMSSKAAAPTLPVLPGSPATVPETVTDDLGGSAEVREVDRVPEVNRSNLARSSFTESAPVTGILIQGSGPSGIGGVVPSSGSEPSQNEAAANAIKIAATPAGDTDRMQAPAAGQPRAAIALPPATVGPLSLRMAAANGDASAEFEVASRLAEGKGTDQSLKEAVVWYQRAATKGFAQAQYRLGTFYERGLGLKADLARARSWYQRAADQGNVKAMHNLAVLAAGKAAATPDYTTAVQWFTQAANYGLADSQFNLAVLTESGLGVEKIGRAHV